MTRWTVLRIAGLVLVTVFVAGCDKCGNRLQLNAPTIPNACGVNADPGR